jgi:phage/plasmid-like protein (TIGR03299 family)
MLESARSMIYVGETPWHKLGIKLDAPPTTAEAMKCAGMDWEVGLKALQTSDGEPVSHKACYRKSDGKIFGVVGPAWTPLQNAEAFSWFDPFLEAKEASIETAGSLFGGSRIWVLAKLNRDPMTIVKGDDVLKYVLLSNAHDGKVAVRVGFTPVRVVCANTLSMATNSEASKLIRVRHTRNVEDVLVAVRDAMNLANAQFEATAEQYRFLARVKCTGDDLAKYVNVVFKRPAPVGKKAKAPETSSELVNAILDDATAATSENDFSSRCVDAIRENFESGKGNTMRGVKGTWWAAYNAATEYLTHQRGKTDENRLAAQFNDAMQYNRQFLSTACAMAAAA